MHDITHQNFEAELDQRLDRSSRCCSTSGRRGAARARRSARCSRSSRPPTPAASSSAKLNADEQPEIARPALADVRRAQHPVLRAVQGRPAGRRLRRRAARGRGPQVPRQARAERRRAGRRGGRRSEAEELLAEGDTDAALDKLQAARRDQPGQRRARATTTCARCSTPAASPMRARPSSRSPRKALLDARLAAARPLARGLRGGAEGAPADALAAAIAANKRDFDARFELAQTPLRRAAASRRRWTSCSRS